MQRPSDPLHSYVLRLVKKTRPRVCFLPTASGDLPAYITEFYKAYDSGRCRPTHLQLFFREVLGLEDFLLEQDVIHVGGGNTANMLDIWRRHGVNKILKKAWEQGTVMCGGSAGAICWFEGGITDSFGSSKLEPLNEGLGLLQGSVCPHYDVDALRQPAYRTAIAQKRLPAGYAIQDRAALYFENERLAETVSSDEGSEAFFVKLVNGVVQEESLDTRYIT